MPRILPFLPPRSARILTAATCAGALLLTGCSTPSDDPDRGCTTSTDADGARPIDLAPVTVTVLEPGAGQAAVPTITPRTDVPQRVTVSSLSKETSVLADEQGQAPSSTTESLTLPLTVRAGCTDPTVGEFTFGAPVTPDAALQPDLAVFDGALGGVTYGDGLAPAVLRIAPPTDAAAPAGRAVEQALVNVFTHAPVLPDTPVAPGARWQVVRTISAATTVTQTMTVTLTAWDGDRLALDVAFDEDPVEPVFRIPGSPDTLNLIRFANAGSGTVTVDRTRLIPVSGRITLSGARELSGDSADGASLLQQTTAEISWETPGA